MSRQPHDSGIDYLRDAYKLIGRKGKAYNPCSGCKNAADVCSIAGECWAMKTIRGRLRGNPSYPYGTQPTFRPDMIKPVGTRSKWLIALNFMGDVGGDWFWDIDDGVKHHYTPTGIALSMQEFALLNPQHIILLLTKRPEWYGLVAEWPPNVWCGFTATNNREFNERCEIIYGTGISDSRVWCSLEPWLDESPPQANRDGAAWLVIGGQSGPNARPVSVATLEWLQDESIQAKRFTKDNAIPDEYEESHPTGFWSFPREYPAEWRVE